MADGGQTQTHTHARTNTRTHACTHIHTHVCMHTHHRLKLKEATGVYKERSCWVTSTLVPKSTECYWDVNLILCRD